jgi:hypothetical protein
MLRKLALAMLMLLASTFTLAQTPPGYDPTVLVEWTAPAPVEGVTIGGYHIRWAEYDYDTNGPLGLWTILLDPVGGLDPDDPNDFLLVDALFYQFDTGDIGMGSAWDWFTPYIVQVRAVSDLGVFGSWSVSSDPFIPAGSPPGNPGKPSITIIHPE